MKSPAAPAKFDSNPPTNGRSQHCAKSVTVIVPARNEESSIARTLQQLLDQERDGLETEILVVDGRSTDRTREIVQDFAARHGEVRLLDNPKGLSSAARNIGIRESCGNFLVIVDGHCEFPSRLYFLDLVQAFAESGADCLGRPQPLEVSQATTLQRAIAAARSSWLGHHPDSFVYTEREVDCPAASVAVAYRRSIFEEVGHFDERFDACEDCDLNHRIDKASLRCRFVPSLAVQYQPRKTLGGLFRQMYRYGRGRVRLLRKHPESFRITSTLRAVLFAIIAGLLACWAIPSLRTPFLVATGVYLTIVAAMSLWKSIQKRDAKLLLWMPVAFMTIHLGAGIGIIAETFIGMRKKHFACAE